MHPTRVHFLFDIPAMVDLCRQQHLVVASTGDPSHGTARIDAQGDFLNTSFTLPLEPDGKRAPLYDSGPACPQEFARFRGSTRHKRCAILVAHRDFNEHDVCKTSLWELNAPRDCFMSLLGYDHLGLSATLKSYRQSDQLEQTFVGVITHQTAACRASPLVVP